MVLTIFILKNNLWQNLKFKKSGKLKKSFGPKSEKPKKYKGQGR